MVTLDEVWAKTYGDALYDGRDVSPRGKQVRELEHHTVAVDMHYPVLTNRARKLNYQFMAAEALWIYSASDRLDELTPYNPRMAEFSDDGETLAGAYGPRIDRQLNYVVGKLLEDRDTRQATLTIWNPNPEPSKDIPCTVAMTFTIRENKLNLHVYMRSSDIWLGLPYDVFSFTCVALMVRASYNLWRGLRDPVTPGTLYVTAASSHLYQEHWYRVIDSVSVAAALPLDHIDRIGVLPWLEQLRGSRRGDPERWWES